MEGNHCRQTTRTAAVCEAHATRARTGSYRIKAGIEQVLVHEETNLQELLSWTRLSLLADSLGDNQGTVFTAHNPNQNQRSKHLDIRYFKVRQYIEEKLVNVLFVPTKLNLADFFTKSLHTQAYTRFRDIIMGTQVYSNLSVAQQSLFLTFQQSLDVSTHTEQL